MLDHCHVKNHCAIGERNRPLVTCAEKVCRASMLAAFYVAALFKSGSFTSVCTSTPRDFNTELTSLVAAAALLAARAAHRRSRNGDSRGD